jgi:hypothetical protein
MINPSHILQRKAIDVTKFSNSKIEFIGWTVIANHPETTLTDLLIIVIESTRALIDAYEEPAESLSY